MPNVWQSTRYSHNGTQRLHCCGQRGQERLYHSCHSHTSPPAMPITPHELKTYFHALTLTPILFYPYNYLSLSYRKPRSPTGNFSALIPLSYWSWPKLSLHFAIRKQSNYHRSLDYYSSTSSSLATSSSVLIPTLHLESPLKIPTHPICIRPSS